MRKQIFVFALSLVLSVMFTSQALAQIVITEDEIVRAPNNSPVTNNWMLYTRDTGTGTFVDGPAIAPGGTGSLQLSTPLNLDKVFLFNYDHIGTALSTINAISYHTYRSYGNLQQVASINILVDVNGSAPGGFTALVFEPVYNTSQGAVQDGVWQYWDAYNSGNAIWWSSAPIPGACSFSCFVTWNSILAANPSAVIAGGLGINQGGGNPALVSAADLLTIGKGGPPIIYDFERVHPPLYTLPSNKDECKNGGWANFNPPTGPFKNQGECVASTVGRT